MGLNAGVAIAQNGQSRAAAPHVDSSSISIDELLPGTIPVKGSVVVSGTLHNGSGTTWHHLKVVPQMSQYPISSESELANDAVLDPRQVTLGSSMPDLGAAVADLAPGKSVRFTIRIARVKMPITGASGAYWLGVVPTSDEAHPDALTARTFLPLLPKANKKARMNIALVVPLRESPLRKTSGALADAPGFATELSPRGRLGRIAAFGQNAGSRALTWLVDPALLDLADDSARGTTAYAVGLDGTALPHPAALPTPSGSPTSTGSPSSTPTGSSSSNTPSGSASPSASPTTSPADAAALAARMTAQTWLATVTPMLRFSAMYALPYADPATAPLVATGHASLLTSAVALSTQSLAARNLQALPAVAPAGGNLSESEWSALAAGQTVFVKASSAARQSMVSDGRTLVVASTASQGGPGPSNQTSALNLRQRLLAEASLTIGTKRTTNLTVVLPSSWDPGSAAGIRTFFTQLTRPWLAFTGLPIVSSGTATLSRTPVRATPKQKANIAAALALRASAARLSSVLATTTAASGVLARQLAATELSTMSYDASTMPVRYQSNAARTSAYLTGLLKSVRVEGTQFVTLSGSSGVITVALHNGLNQPIRVGLRQIRKVGGDTVQVDPVAAVTLEPGERSTLRVNLTAHRVSVQVVTLSAVNSHGVPFGTPLTFTLRSSPIGAVVWAITIAIMLLLAVLVVRRLRRRLRAKREAP